MLPVCRGFNRSAASHALPGRAGFPAACAAENGRIRPKDKVLYPQKMNVV
jgi:hypothetical protein